MNFDGEHLLPGQLGHFFIILSFVASLLATVFYFTASRQQDIVAKESWLKFARIAFLVQVTGVVIIFSIIFYICSNHLYEYMYAYKHASKELEYKYLLACIWEGQEGSFLLWTIWHSVLGCVFIFGRKKAFANGWEAPVMTVISFAQFFLLMMILGIYFFGVKIGNSPFTLTRNEGVLDRAPIFFDAVTNGLRKDYLSLLKDGMGLNVLLRNYWMVIHPPILFLGFASTIIPFAYAYAGIQTKRFGDWVKPVLPWALFSACVLGVGIMMGGKWAYESLSFGGYWAWDPVENASLVPWLILIAGLHTMVVYKATGHSLRASYLFAFLTLGFILYSTFLTRTGVLGDTSVHAFTDAGKSINIMIGIFVASFVIPSLVLYGMYYKQIPTIHKEENTNSREFWMFIGSLVFFLTAMFITAKTSVPVFNLVFNTKIAPPENVEFSYNKIIALVAIIIGLLTAVTQYLKYKDTKRDYFLKNIIWPTIVSALLTTLLVIFYPLTYYKEGAGFLGVLYAAMFASIYAVVANSFYIWKVLKGKVLNAGASVAHAGFALMIFGMILSSANKEIISSSKVNGITLPSSKDPMTKQQDDPRDNLTLIRQMPTTMGEYEVTYQNDSAGHEKGRKYYKLAFEKKDPVTKKVTQSFNVEPDVYIMKDNNMSSNPDTKSYLNRDIFTYVSYALNDNSSEDTAQFKVTELAEGDTAKYSNGILVLNRVTKNPHTDKYHFAPTDVALMADLTVTTKDGKTYKANPVIQADQLGIRNFDDTLYAQNLFVRFAGVEGKNIKLGLKESDKLIDFVTVKSYVFPYINLVWLGLIVMAIGLIVSMIRRAACTKWQAATILLLAGAGLFYMFLLAN